MLTPTLNNLIFLSIVYIYVERDIFVCKNRFQCKISWWWSVLQLPFVLFSRFCTRLFCLFFCTSVTPALHIHHNGEVIGRSFIILPWCLFLDIKALSSELGAVIKPEALEYDRSVKRKEEWGNFISVQPCAIQSGSTDKKRIPPLYDQRSEKFSSYRIFHVWPNRLTFFCVVFAVSFLEFVLRRVLLYNFPQLQLQTKSVQLKGKKIPRY